MLRLGMANVLFKSEEVDEEDENYDETLPKKKLYPPLNKGKTNLNTELIGRNEIIEEGIAWIFNSVLAKVTYSSIVDAIFHNPFFVPKAKKGKKKKKK